MLKRLARWYLARCGWTVVETATHEKAMAELGEVKRTLVASGHLNTMTGRRPKVVRRVDRAIGRVEALMEVAGRWAA